MALDPFQRRLLKSKYAGPSRIRTYADSPTPAGYRHRLLVKIPESHVGSRVMQDRIEDTMLRQIRHERPGPRRDYLIRDLEYWRQNGKPTYYQPPKGKGQRSLSSAEPVRTWRGGKPLWKDVEGDREQLRRILRGGSTR